MRYFTVQDTLWINLQVTNKVIPYDYALLEEASNYQYSLGKSLDVYGQAGRLLYGFLKLDPFQEENRKTAILCFLTFLAINGLAWTLSSAETDKWIAGFEGRKPDGDSVKAHCQPDETHQAALVKVAVPEILAAHRDLLPAA